MASRAAQNNSSSKELRLQCLRHVTSRAGLTSLQSRLEQETSGSEITVEWSLQYMLKDIDIEMKYLNMKRTELEKRFEAGRMKQPTFKAKIRAANLRLRDLGMRRYRLKRMEFKGQPVALRQDDMRENHAIRLSLIKLLFYDFRSPSFSNHDHEDWTEITASTYGMRQSNSEVTGWSTLESAKDSNLMAPVCFVAFDTQPEIIDWICGPGVSSRKLSTDNCYMIPSVLEPYISQADIAIVPVDPLDTQAVRLCFRLLNVGIKDTVISSPNVTLETFDGQEVLFHGHVRPTLSFVYLSFILNMVGNRISRWIEVKDRYDTTMSLYPSSVLKQFLRESFLMELQRRCKSGSPGGATTQSETSQRAQEERTDPYSLDEIVVDVLLSDEIYRAKIHDDNLPGYFDQLEFVGSQADYNSNKRRNLTLWSLADATEPDQDCLSVDTD